LSSSASGSVVSVPAFDQKDWKRSWQRITDKIRVYGAPPTLDPGRLLEDALLEVESYRDALVSRREIVNEKDGVKFESLAQWYSRGAIYDSNLKILKEFDEPTEAKFDNPPEISTERFEAATRVAGKCIYLGTLHGHFGHFLVESLARAWALTQVEPELPVVFHYAHPAGGQLFPDPDNIGLPGFIRVVFKALGIAPGRLILANRDLVVDELLVPKSQLRLRPNGIGAPGLPIVYDFLREELLRSQPDRPAYPEKVYLTRTRLASNKHKSVVNEQEIEDLFSRYGFEIVAPEKLTFSEQVALISHATHVAGTTGSALHMALFNNRPDARVVAVDWRNNRTQYILEAARGLQGDHIYCYDGRADGNRPLADVEVVERALFELYGAPALSTGAARPALQTAMATSEKPKPRSASRSESGPPLLPPDWLFDLVPALQRCKPQAGTVNYGTLTICGFLATIQTSLGIQGDFLEMSHNPGHQLLDVLALQPGEKGMFRVESRDNQVERWQVAGIPEDRRKRAAVFEHLDEALNEDGRVFRWVHVEGAGRLDLDAGIERLARALGDGGLLLVSNFFDVDVPAATESVFAFLAAESDWAILAIAPGFACLVKKVWKERYERQLKSGARQFLSKCGAFKLTEVGALQGAPVLAVKGNPNRLTAALRKN